MLPAAILRLVWWHAREEALGERARVRPVTLDVGKSVANMMRSTPM